MNPFVFSTSAQIVFRPGAASAIGDLVKQKLGRRILFVTDPGLRQLGLCEPALASLTASGIETTVFDGVEADPSLATVMAAAGAAKADNVSGVIGFGGGSSLDVAKVVALLCGSGEPLDEAWGVGNAKGPRLPLVLVPTTAGTGSEVTPVSIITVGGDEKRGVSSSIILPDIAILDPDLTLSLPAHITAATGIDAMVHAIEAYASKSANNNPLSKMLARQALQLLGSNIEKAVLDGKDRVARGAMLLGSMLAGQAFANSPVAAVHALAYPIGGTFHIPHGLSNALVLPHVLQFNSPDAASIYAEIAADVFPELASEQGHQRRCAAFIEGLAGLSLKLGLQPRLRDVGIGEEHLAGMARDAMKQTRLLVNNPREIGEADALSIYRAAW
ncbi:Alcohol dehydrogenase, iron-dependent (plasmid) [Neorhizobium galegae bv. officinalis bv. officinalis str. HAMBI 1141]|uniref:Alcohol dehydrogenase 2 n=1 Tax=Neorhizobium galegae bv. officinalis bv. officinalis str. HAMBI 1141 TaxID=1028801 RepID=A0A068THL4_NEOGA|nr:MULTISPECIES: iron-containing alcohol dehydrogenase [Neorhizobium]MCJ9669367.1 iron-containing alcohol dehydrogenase [Neorhizobium sp. SHOUNA12B]MCJ9745235.1 iron-containing alcohol dehydrogenase [Neorhizobium sp. SHOUNA12A]CDN57566.1 Alcohol dehydrogenase, iron-dependent [Neorhizobium galegae bv. officinalis bv. officinalis str. HAMBI 1141]